MDAKELARLVQAMRKMQRRYFRSGKEEIWDEAKRLEDAVDWAIIEVLSAPVQASLFEEGDI